MHFNPIQNTFTVRLIVMDSKFDDQKCKKTLTIAANTVHRHFRIAMREALAMAGKQRELQELRLVRCESLPCQENESDCGWYMVLYAELFTRNMNWMVAGLF
ncbi:hypothetical protein KIN20_011989 [Parelaphostrongylus tenuis]|uniref:Ubiquitin-like protease family profile domain-containing protein n=1 Tax=Parelaphostrongylus tenuis TaxID=148309 RepID=A0AAD5MA83_PARTN|nr:hypothetical protein KIN20_011989 [Parelaphostrongylus tenuis]